MGMESVAVMVPTPERHTIRDRALLHIPVAENEVKELTDKIHLVR